MSNTGIFWIREDFRIENNPALSFATQNHDNVIALYIYNNNDFDKAEKLLQKFISQLHLTPSSIVLLQKQVVDKSVNN